MYAHPAFVRGQPETLVRLRKSTSASRRRLLKVSSDDSDTPSDVSSFRSVSLSPPRDHGPFQPIVQTRTPAASLSINKQPLLHPIDHQVQAAPLLSATKNPGKCRLDLLALALEREESCSSVSSDIVHKSESIKRFCRAGLAHVPDECTT